MQPQVTIAIVSGSLQGTKYTFNTPGTYSIGREEERAVPFPDNSSHANISRYHCDLQIVQLEPPNITITDRQSTHGTFVNGRKISQATLLQDQDTITLGDVAIEIHINGTPAATPQTTNVITPPAAAATPAKVAVPAKIVQAGKEVMPKFLGAIKNFLELSPKAETAIAQPASTPDVPPPPPLQFKDYEVGRLLGQGAFSEVYLATHKESGQQVALKILQPEVAKREDAVQKFIRETDNTKALNHPNVVKLLDFSYYQGAFFYTTEYCEGGSLFGLQQQLGGKLSLGWSKAIALQILDGLEYTHNVEVSYVKLAGGGFGQGKGLVHRSLKPENILLTHQQGRLIAKISDFALAKAFGTAGLSGQTVVGGSFAGTPYYMPRAQLMNFQTSQPAVDVWAAAACFYEMLTGLPPRNFDGTDEVEVIAERPAVPILERAAYIPPGLAEVIDRALKEEADHSTFYQSAMAFKQDLLAAW